MAFFNIELEKYKGDRKYSTGLKIPQYMPSGEKVDLEGCIDKTKYNELISVIENSSLYPEKKALYKLAATRFIEFKYNAFAEYYANLKESPDKDKAKEEQEIIEKLGLVIVDIDNAIHNGFVKLNSFIEDVLMKSDKYKKDIIDMKNIPTDPQNIAALTRDEKEESK